MAGLINPPGHIKPEPLDVALEIVENEIEFSEVVFRQSVLETLWMRCNYCSLSKNNLFGFRYTAEYIEFDCWEESVEYYKGWQQRKFTRYHHPENYYYFLKVVGYAAAEDYEQKLRGVRFSERLKKVFD